MIDLIEKRFQANLTRIGGLMILNWPVGNLPGEITMVLAGDLLRFSVVLLHAALEDVLRSLAELRLPQADAEVFKAYTKEGKLDRYSLADLRDHRGVTITDFVKSRIASFLDAESFNNVGQVRGLLRNISLPDTAVVANKEVLTAMMKRRHLIAHRADREAIASGASEDLHPIDGQTVLDWYNAVDAIGRAVIEAARISSPGDAESSA